MALQFAVRTLLISLALVAAFVGNLRVVASDLLVSDRATNRILAYDATTGAFSRVLVAADANLFSPAAMTIGFDGDLFVASQGTGKVLRYDSVTGASKGVFADLGLPAGPAGLLYDLTTNRLFVSTLGNSDSTVVDIMNSSGAITGSVNAGPAGGRTGVALDGSGNVYVNSFNTDGFSPSGGETGAVLRFNGGNSASMDTLIAGDGTYNNSFFGGLPVNVAGMNGLILGGSSLYAASMFGQEVLKLDAATGAVQAVMAAHFQGGPPTAYPAGLLFDTSGNVLVTTLGNNNPSDPAWGAFTFPGSIQKFATDGTFLGVLVSDGDSLNDEPGVGFQPTAAVVAPVIWSGGGGNGNWSTFDNWNLTPSNGDSLLFTGTTQTTTTNGSLSSVQSITFKSTAGAFSISGNALSIAGGIANNSTNTQTINLNLTLSAAQASNAISGNLVINGAIANGGNTLTVTGSANTTLAGAISGGGGLVKAGSGVLTVSGNNGYGGGTTVDSGTLIVGSVNALGTGGLSINGTATAELQPGLSAPVQLSSLTIAGATMTIATLDVVDNTTESGAPLAGAGGSAASAQTSVQSVPEPSTLVLAALGLAGVVICLSNRHVFDSVGWKQ